MRQNCGERFKPLASRDRRYRAEEKFRSTELLLRLRLRLRLQLKLQPRAKAHAQGTPDRPQKAHRVCLGAQGVLGRVLTKRNELSRGKAGT